MKKVVSACFVIFFLVCAKQNIYAQGTLFAGIKGGISIPNLKASGNNPVSSGWSSRLGGYFGIIAQYEVNERFSVQAEINYSAQGGKKDGIQAIPSAPYAPYFPPGFPVPEYLYSRFKSEARLNYLEIPVMAKLGFPLGESFSFFINAGPYFGFIMSAENVTTGTENIYLDNQLTQPLLPSSISFNNTQDIKSDLKSFNMGIQAGAGIYFILPSEDRIMLTGGGNYGLIPIQKDKLNGENKTGAATITIAYMMKL